MIWPFKRKHHGPSPEAVEFSKETDRELEDVRRLKSQAQDVGESLRRRKETNHIGMALEAIMRGGPAWP